MRKIRFDGELMKTVQKKKSLYFSDGTVKCSGKQYWEYHYDYIVTGDQGAHIGLWCRDNGFRVSVYQDYSIKKRYFHEQGFGLDLSHQKISSPIKRADYVGIGLDFSARKAHFYENGILVSSIDVPALGEYEYCFYISNSEFGDGNRTGQINVTVNFGETPFTNPCPAGFTPVCDYGGQMVYVTDKDVAYGITAEGTQTLTKLSDHWSSLSDQDKVNALQSVKEEAHTETLKSFADPFKICGLYPQNSNVRGVVKGLKKEKVVTPKKLIRLGNFEALTKASITSTVSGAAAVKVGVTTDLNHYKTYDLVAAKWKDIDMTSADSFISTAMNAADVQLIPAEAWQEILDYVDGGVGFAYCMVAATLTETCNVDKLTFTANMKGAWKSAIKGTAYDYGYPLNDVLQVKIYADGNYKINYSMGAKAP